MEEEHGDKEERLRDGEPLKKFTSLSLKVLEPFMKTVPPREMISEDPPATVHDIIISVFQDQDEGLN